MMGMMFDDFEKEYRIKEVRRYQEMIDDGKQTVEVPISAVVKMLSENLNYRARIDYLMEQILRHNFNIPQRFVMPNEEKVPPISD